jgi:hypothetical protein
MNLGRTGISDGTGLTIDTVALRAIAVKFKEFFRSTQSERAEPDTLLNQIYYLTRYIA